MFRLFEEYTHTAETVQSRIDEALAVPLTETEQKDIYRRCAGIIDLTTLEGSDTEARIRELCLQAQFSCGNTGLPDAAAVCVYPSLVRIARQSLSGTSIRVASVAGAFPSGQSSLKVKLAEIAYAIDEGAQEIDTVISRGKLIEGREQDVFDEISAMRERCGEIHLKVILETGELNTVPLIRRAAELAILAGADFIKTSTGKIGTGATPFAFVIMADTIREYHEKTGKAIGIKPAGGIRTPEQALVYWRLLNDALGGQWMNSSYFRIGASSLAGALVEMFR